MVRNPEQLIWVDETHRSSNDARRRRGWGKRGHTPVIEAHFEEHFRPRYTLIGACDINGFVVPACRIVERESEGTVDMERFERYVDQDLVPTLSESAKTALWMEHCLGWSVGTHLSRGL